MARKYLLVSKHLRELSTCCICQDEVVEMVRCPNFHTCCVGCALQNPDSRCPMCREGASTMFLDRTTSTSLVRCRLRLRCASCGISTLAEETELHRAWCPKYRFLCPYGACGVRCPTSDMRAHVVHHEGVRVLEECMGEFQACVMMTRLTDPYVFCVEDTVVVFSQMKRIVGARDEAFHVSTFAYYAGMSSPRITATIRQLSLNDDWYEEHKMGTVHAVVASRENVNLTFCPVLSPRLTLQSSNPSDMKVVFPNDVPTGSYMRSLGLAETPQPNSFTGRQWNGVQAAMVHLIFRVDRETSIGSEFAS